MSLKESLFIASGKQGRYITPELSSDSSSLQNVLGFIQDYIPQSYSSGGPKIEKEKVLWAKFETADCNDLSMSHHHDCIDDSLLPLVLFLGLTNSFSVWIIPPGGDAREVYVYQNDPVKMAILLKTPQSPVDAYKDHRPIIGIVKRCNNSRSLFSSLVFVSLSKTDSITGREVKRIEFEKNAIMDIKLNRRFIIVVLQKRLVVLNSATLQQTFVIKTGYVSSDSWVNPVALGVRWLAITDTTVHKHLLSVGGASEHLTPPVVSTVVNTVRKGFAAISDTISGFTGRGTISGSQMGNISPENPLISSSSSPASVHPVVTVLNLQHSFTMEEVRVSELRKSEGIVAHFLAHSSSDVFITMMAFNKSGELLFTADSEGQCFNVFKILNGSHSDCTTVQHLYSLYRGSTPGKVQDVCFSNDSRLVGVSTLNGTTHVFPISTYGGPCTVRTHTSPQVVNQLTRFHTSAGIGSLHSSSTPSNPTSSLTSSLSSLQPSTQQSSSAQNGLVPLIVTPLQQIKQSYSSGISTGSNITPSLSTLTGSHSSSTVSSEDKSSFNTCIKAVFTAVHARTDYSDHGVQYSLYTVNGLGEVVEYLLVPQKSAASSSSSSEEDEGPVDLTCTPRLKWRLLSKIMEECVPLPLNEENPLIMAHNEYKRYINMSKEVSRDEVKEKWLSEVELLTYAPPTRRLWMGPQFSFKTFSDDHQDVRQNASSSAPILQPTYDVTELMGVSHFELNSIHANQMSSYSMTTKGKGSDSNDQDTEGLNAGVEVFGSWKDIAPKLKTIRSDSNLEQQIMDAIQDGGVSSLTPPTSSGDKRQHVPLFTGYRQQPSKTQVGFHPPSAMM